MTMTLGMVTVDCADPVALAGFWTKALGVEVVQNFEDAYLVLAPQEGTGVSVALQQVPEERAGKNRLHLDFGTGDRAAEVARLVGLGATELREHSVPGLDWTVLADPEGNEFCVGTPH
ncbi:VOC family protein [Amycolatopsis suaedae]|uniref:VOC family protein n=1 Tax=Amycolatopsis suaedae TaxID=2510978 RepID=A0A4Q7JCT3_9PSEU|nr:VOC family protein [Amycolatopsis suaedae]RZQ64856.1 VOC family protein [Amycolatopsis suaedae]